MRRKKVRTQRKRKVKSSSSSTKKTQEALSSDMKRAVIMRIQQSADRIVICLSHLDDDELWKDFSENLVSAGNLILHLIGNISQHIISGLGGQQYVRERALEFSSKPDYSRVVLKGKFLETIRVAIQTIQNLRTADLLKKYNIQGIHCSGIEDVIAVTEHLSYHVGQITWIVKHMKRIDIGYYRGVNLNIQNRHDEKMLRKK